MNPSETAKHLKRQVPSQVDVVFVLVHPHFCHPQGVSFHGHAQVRHVGLVGSLNVGDLRAWNHLNAASTCPHLHNKHILNTGDSQTTMMIMMKLPQTGYWEVFSSQSNVKPPNQVIVRFLFKLKTRGNTPRI